MTTDDHVTPDPDPDDSEHDLAARRRVRASLTAPPPIDPDRRDAHLAVAMLAYDELHAVGPDEIAAPSAPGHGSRRHSTRWLVAAATIAVLGIGGAVLTQLDGSERSAEDTAARRGDSEASTRDAGTGSRLATPGPVSDAASPEAFDGGADQQVSGVDLGEFTDDDELRRSLADGDERAAATADRANAEAAPPVAGSADREREGLRSGFTPCPDVIASSATASVERYTATVGGVGVEVQVVTDDDSRRVVILDAATCEPRTG